MKTRIELSTTEADLITSVHEVKKMIENLDTPFLEMKVYYDRNRNKDAGWTWLNIHKTSRAEDIIKVYELDQQLRKQLARIDELEHIILDLKKQLPQYVELDLRSETG